MKRSSTIGFDARYAPVGESSRGSYARLLVEALAEACPRRSYLRMYTSESGDNAEFKRLTSRHNVEAMSPDGALWRKLTWLWREWHIVRDLRRGDVELYHSLSATLPFGLERNNIRSVVSVHNLDFLALSSFHNPVKNALHRLAIASAVGRADRVVAASECVKRDIVRYFSVNADKVDVIYRSCHPRFAEPLTEEHLSEVASRLLLPKRYILTVGTQREYKNIGPLIEGMSELPADLHFVIVGGATKYTKHIRFRIKSLGLEHRVHIIHNVDEEDMPAIYRLATLYVHPSRYEGFATPIVEALTVGIPVIAAMGSSLEEAGGPDSIYVDPDDREALIRSIITLLNDDELRSEMATRGREYASRFRPEVIAYNIQNCYRRIGVDIAE